MKRDARRHRLSPSPVPADPIGREEFKIEVQAWADRLDVEPVEIHIAAMRRKWASCSTRGRVTFAADLLVQPTEFRREVIVHELLHLKVPNHGPLFRALLSAHLADTPTASQQTP